MELGIVIILSAVIMADSQRMNQEIYNDLKIKNVTNVPHISLFQGRFPEKNQAQLEQAVAAIAHETAPFKIEMENNLIKASENIFWLTKSNDSLIKLHQKILAEIPRYTDGLLMQQVIDMPPSSLTAQQKQKIKKYGIYWVEENFLPHITIFYSSYDHPKIPAVLAQVKPSLQNAEFTVTKIAIARLGYVGNVESILQEYRLAF